MSENIVRIPTLDASIFDQGAIVSLTKAYLDDNEQALTLGSELLDAIDCFDPDDDHFDPDNNMPEAILQSLFDAFDEDAVQAFYRNTNVIAFLQDALSQGASLQSMPKRLLAEYPIFSLIDEDADIMEERIERATENQYGEFYPLYCKPDSDSIRLFLDKGINIGFVEIGEGNYFAHLTACGRLFSAEIAFAYLEVDGCIPPNIATDNIDLSTTDPFIRDGIKAYLGMG